jgi:hypothetical protein
MKKVSKENVRAFAAHMASKYRVKIVDRSQPRPRAVMMMLKMMGITNVHRWLSRWSVTAPGVIWLGFDLVEGVESVLKGQVATICHELKHIEQWRRDRFRFALRYAFSRSRRSHYEAQALHCNLEMGHALGLNYEPAALAQTLRNYRVRQADINVTATHLEAYNRAVKKGARGEQVVKEACAWWRV